ncbi:hypothetical protein STAFG_1696 [Streptomyces afghaniensis 772]|uniref:N-acetyltransferase domain-containing protein n=1 Tax=Streptomyces afghaniensis 772 TaxID=1283301 RepID=S4MNX9_9ACTN|nr:hypothetical protein STAFG_1696 [Streptomyces afghaniensis 772]
MAGLLHDPERMVLPELVAYPAHLHIDLLPEWQGRGHGRRLMRTFLATLQDKGVPAVHLAMATANTRATGLLRPRGLPRARRPRARLGHLPRPHHEGTRRP